MYATSLAWVSNVQQLVVVRILASKKNQQKAPAKFIIAATNSILTHKNHSGLEGKVNWLN